MDLFSRNNKERPKEDPLITYPEPYENETSINQVINLIGLSDEDIILAGLANRNDIRASYSSAYKHKHF